MSHRISFALKSAATKVGLMSQERVFAARNGNLAYHEQLYVQNSKYSTCFATSYLTESPAIDWMAYQRSSEQKVNIAKMSQFVIF